MRIRLVLLGLTAVLLLVGCGQRTKTVYVPYSGTQPAMPLEQAQDICGYAAKGASEQAKNRYDDKQRSNTYTVTTYSGNMAVTTEQPVSGGFWGGFFGAANRKFAGKRAYKPVFRACMAEKGYREIKYKVKVEPPLQKTRMFNGLNDGNICRLALSANRETPNWDNKTNWREPVNEAKRRDLTPKSCAKLLGWNTVSPEKKPPEDGNVEKRLTKLKNLFEKGLITKDEYERKRGKILEAL